MSFSVHGTYVAVPAQIAVQPFSQGYAKFTGLYYSSALVSGDAVIDTPSENYLFAEMFILPRTTTFDRMSISVQTPQVGGKYRIGIYADTGGIYPGALVLDAGELNASAAAIVEATVSLTLNAGIYWKARNANVANISMHALSPITCPAFGRPDMDTEGHTGYYKAAAYGALPSTYPAAADASNIADIIGLRVA